MPRLTRSQDEPSSTMHIGIDFGTTYSGIAFAHSSKPQHVQVVSNWVDGRNTDKGKCPTLLTYKNSQVANWGYGAVDSPDAIKWFKLLLLRPEDLPPDVRESEELRASRNKMLELDKDPVELIADYLRKLWGLACEKMVKSSSQTLVDSSLFQVNLTVPAIWPDYAKDMMREAAVWAGICDDRPIGATILDFISEPEAAALATMRDNFEDKITGDGPPIVRVGDCFVVCDAGGGTADLITYKIKSVNPWKIEECVRGDGKLCGAMVLDKGFRSLLESKIHPQNWQQVSEESNIFSVQWEKVIKREYKANAPEQIIHLPFGSSAMMGRDWKPIVTLSRDELGGIFKPVTQSIKRLVLNQISKIPRHRNYKGQSAKYVVLVGGLGSSQHLYECLKSGLSSLPQGPEILQSEGDLPWTSISRGAVLHGFNQQKLRTRAVPGAPNFSVEARIARRSYGTVCTFEHWNPNIHRKEDRRYCPIEDCYVADYQMSWFVRAGDSIREGEIKSCAFSQTFEESEDLAEGITTELVYSDAESPPKRCDGSVKKLCDIRWDPVPSFESLPERTTDAGREVRDASYDIEMTFKGASAYFAI